MNILGIETSCDETSVGVVDGDGLVLANVIATQVDIHARYGGIVPEVASRQHVLDIRPVCEQAITDAGIDWGDIDAVAATHGPGLAGSLIVGLNFSKGLAATLGVPLVGVNHMDGHVYGAWARTEDRELEPFQDLVGEQPIMCLVVSGGHTELVLLEGHGKFRLLARPETMLPVRLSIRRRGCLVYGTRVALKFSELLRAHLIRNLFPELGCEELTNFRLAA